MVYYEAGLLDEKEFTAWVGLSPADKEFNGKKGKTADREIMPVTICDEEGHFRDFYLVSLEGLNPGDVLSMRKVQLQYFVDIIMDEHLLPLGRQFAREQPKNWFDFAGKDHCNKMRSGGLKISERAKLPLLTDIMNKASSIIEARENQEEQLAAEQLESEAMMGTGANYLDDIDDEQDEGPKHVQLGDSTGLLGTMGATAVASDKKKSKPAKRKRDKAEEDDEEMDEVSQAGSTTRLVELTKTDPVLAAVATKHEKLTGRPAPKCFFEGLSVRDAFARNNQKQKNYGVPCLPCCCAFFEKAIGKGAM